MQTLQTDIIHPVSLAALLADYHLPAQKSFDVPITGVSIDSRQLKPGEVFLAYPGFKTDGREYIAQALAAGASAILYEPMNFSVPPQDNIPLVAFPNLKEHLGSLVARWFNYPTRYLHVVGVTGTNGKTSCSHFLAHSLTKLGSPCGILGTVGAGLPPALKINALTTPHVVEIQQLAADLVTQGATALAMEVSSHALVQGRVNSVHFSTAVFTNLTQDHLDYHGSMAAYGAAKAQLFHWPSLQNAIINLDDPFGYALYLELKEQPQLNVVGYTSNKQTFSLGGQVVHARHIRSDRNGIQAHVITPWGEGLLHSKLIGHFQLHNLLAVLASLGTIFIEKAQSHTLNDILNVMHDLQGVPGRMQCFGGGDKPLVIVDYAHTPDALLNVLQSLRTYKPRKLWNVFGCGGDRDTTKRPLMGKIAADWSDAIIITNDNPRTESPQKIIEDILAGIRDSQHFTIEYDRTKAITAAILQAEADDIVLIAGKGHENYQVMGNERLHFSDAEVVREVLKHYSGKK